MTDSVLELFPDAGRPRALEGLYRDAPLGGKSSGPFVYTNFVTSLDGRIALDGGGGQHRVPSAIANPRDWRLFQELAAHADVIVTSGRYLRDLSLGKAQDHLPVGEADAFADLRRWRLDRGMSAQPDIAILSYGLSFVLPDSLLRQGRNIHIFAAQPLNAAAVRHHEAAGARVHPAPPGEGVRGDFLVRALEELGYRNIYSVTGPKVMNTLVRDGVLDALYLTIRTRLIGGAAFETILEGPALVAAEDFRLASMYLDTAPGADPGQLFMRFDRIGRRHS